jgi:aldose sugar dehydrogenase
MKKIPLLFTLSLASLFIACSNNEKETVQEQPKDESDSIPTAANFVVDTITNELDVPWGLAFLPDGRILITEKSGDIRIVENGKLLEEKIQGVPEVHDQGQGGLLDIQLHPDYENNGWLYLTYAKPVQGGAVTALARAKLNGNRLVELKEIFVTNPVVNSSHHFGSRVAFDNDGYLFVTVGERGTKENAQELSNDYGKVHRLMDDGSIPEDNPFVDSANAEPSIWSYGHRNEQGLYFDTDSGILWEHEHGPKGGDELNIVEKGKNYGWPVITYGIDYDGSTISEISEKEGMEQPVHYWVPSIAPSGLTMAKGDLFPGWKGNLFIGALAHRQLTRVVLDGNEFKEKEILLKDVGRVRAVKEGPDGHIYVAVEGPGMLLKLSPGK